MSHSLASLASWWNWLVSKPSIPDQTVSKQPCLEALENRITPTTTSLVKDINPGGLFSNPRYLTNVNGTLFFSADDGVNGYELWKSDGTSAGTQLVKDISTIAQGDGGNSSFPSYLTNVNGTLFFSAGNAAGYELWKSDGTAAGTQLVKDIYPGGNSSNPTFLENVNGTLFFSADGGGGEGTELWKSDGTVAGTQLVKDIQPGALFSGSYPSFLTNVNGTLFFSANDGSAVGYELWKSDGTGAGTQLVKDINALGNSRPSFLANVNGTLFFSANEGNTGYELWKSDGTLNGTQLVKDINNVGFGFSSFPSSLVNANGTLFFAADDGIDGLELWKSDGTNPGTVLVKNINPIGDSDPSDLANVNGFVFFGADNGTTGSELWSSDGTAAGTRLEADIMPGPNGSDPASLATINGTLFFSADDGTTGRELWRASVAVSDPDLVDASDTGNSNTDNLTNDTTPTFTGTADPNATVTLFDGNTLLGTAANNAGAWTFTVLTPLADGLHTITARAMETGLFAVSNPLDVTIDSTPPTVTINQAATQTDPTFDTSIQFTAIFSEPIFGFDITDVQLGGTAGANTVTITPVSTTEFTITVTGMVQPGTVTAQIVAGAGFDAAGNASLASTSTDNSVQFNVVSPTPPIQVPMQRLAVGADAGGTPLVEVFDANGNLLFGFFAYTPSFTGGVRVATGDFNGDLVEDIVTGAGAGGGPHVRVFDGTNGALITEFFAYTPTFTGGVFVAVGDLDNDGVNDIITGAGAGGTPHVRAFSGAGKGTLADFFAYDAGFGQGVTVAMGDVDGDSFDDIITGAGAGGGPHVRVFSGAGKGTLADFFAFAAGFTGGIFVGSGDLNNDGSDDIIVGAGVGASAHVRVFGGNGTGTLADFFAFGVGFTGGVRVGSLDRNGDGVADIVLGAGPDLGSPPRQRGDAIDVDIDTEPVSTVGPNVQMFDIGPFGQIDNFFAMDGVFAGGLFVG